MKDKSTRPLRETFFDGLYDRRVQPHRHTRDTAARSHSVFGSQPINSVLISAFEDHTARRVRSQSVLEVKRRETRAYGPFVERYPSKRRHCKKLANQVAASVRAKRRLLTGPR